MNALAMIMAGGLSPRLGILSQKRVEPAVPFAGKYRIIDFVLSNCVNSEILNVGVLTQYQPHSLNDHIRTGRPWDLDHKLSGGVTLLPPYQRCGHSLDWYRGTADAIYQNLDFILERKVEVVLILSGEHVYKMDYRPLVRFHQQHRADVTICATDVPLEEASRLGVLVTDEDKRVVELRAKPRRSSSFLASMGIYVFRTDVLVRRLAQAARSLDLAYDFEKDVLPRMLELGDRLFAYPFRDYWVDVGTVQTYWESNMDLLLPEPPLNLSDPQWSIRTRNEERSPTRIGTGAVISNSLITDGCVIEGRIEGSVISPGVRVRAGAVVRDSVILSDCEIGERAIVDRAILDKNVVVGRGTHVGSALGYTPNHRPLSAIGQGLTLVGKNVRLPAGLCVGRDCVIDCDLDEDDLVPIADDWHTDYPFSNETLVAPDQALVTALAT